MSSLLIGHGNKIGKYKKNFLCCGPLHVFVMWETYITQYIKTRCTIHPLIVDYITLPVIISHPSRCVWGTAPSHNFMFVCTSLCSMFLAFSFWSSVIPHQEDCTKFATTSFEGYRCGYFGAITEFTPDKTNCTKYKTNWVWFKQTGACRCKSTLRCGI